MVAKECSKCGELPNNFLVFIGAISREKFIICLNCYDGFYRYKSNSQN
jgi:hypothetical protein